MLFRSDDVDDDKKDESRSDCSLAPDYVDSKDDDDNDDDEIGRASCREKV